MSAGCSRVVEPPDKRITRLVLDELLHMRQELQSGKSFSGVQPSLIFSDWREILYIWVRSKKSLRPRGVASGEALE